MEKGRMTSLDATWSENEPWPNGWGGEDSLLRALYAPASEATAQSPAKARTWTLQHSGHEERGNETWMTVEGLVPGGVAMERMSGSDVARRLYLLETSGIDPSSLVQKLEYPYVMVSLDREGVLSISALSFSQYREKHRWNALSVRSLVLAVSSIFLAVMLLSSRTSQSGNLALVETIVKSIEVFALLAVGVGWSIKTFLRARPKLPPPTQQDAEALALRIRESLLAKGWEDAPNPSGSGS